MNPEFRAAILQALQLTRSQNAMEATRVIQRAIAGLQRPAPPVDEPRERAPALPPPPEVTRTADAVEPPPQGEVADAEGWGHSTSTEAFPGVRRLRRERPRRPFAAVEPVEHFHQRRDRPDVALGDELASSALNLAKANPRLRPLHLVVREREFCGLRLAGYFRRRMRENSRNSVRRPRCASLTRRNYGGSLSTRKPPRFIGLHGGGCRDRTDGHRSLASLQNEAEIAGDRGNRRSRQQDQHG